METQAEQVTKAIATIIKIATPKQSIRGKQARNRLVRAVVATCKGLMYDKRQK